MPAQPRKPAALAPVPDESGGGGGTFVLADAIAEKRGDHPPIRVDLGSGQPLLIDPIELWPDEVVNLVTAERPVDAVRTLLGTDYERFTAAGGTAVLLLEMLQKGGGLSVGESAAS
jgi:hypothetical protein